MPLQKTGLQAVFETQAFNKGLSDYKRGLSQAADSTEKASSSIGKAAPGANIFQKALGGVGSTLLDVGKIAAGFIIGDMIGGAIRAASAAIPDMIGKASNLNETLSKTNVVFGDAAAEIIAFSEGSATQFGQSQQSALDAAATFGIFGKMAGLTGTDLAGFSTDLVGLSSDLASFHNATPEEVVIALGAALRGEAEPMRRFGVLMDDASLRTKALELGLIKTTKDALTPQQKVLAANALIMAQTADAQGDFAKTSSGLANQQRILAAQLDDVKTTLGSALLPVVNLVMKAFTTFLSSPAAKQGIDWMVKGFAFIGDKLTKLFGIVTSGKNPLDILKIAVLEMFGATAVQNLMAFLKPIEENLPAAIAALSNLWTNVLQPNMAASFAFISEYILPVLSQLWTWLWENLPGAINGFVSFWTGILMPALTTVWEFIQANIFPLLQTLWDWLSVNLPPAIQALSDFWTNTLLPAIEAVWKFLTVDMMPVWVALGELVGTILVKSMERLTAFWENILQPALLAIWKFIQDKIVPIFQSWSNSLGGISGIIETVVGWIDILKEGLINLKLPKWLLPGSPTPFEMGLRGISSALKEINKIALPDFSSNIETGAGMNTRGLGAPSGALVPSLQPAMASQSMVRNTSYNSSMSLGGVTINNGMNLAGLQGMIQRALIRS